MADKWEVWGQREDSASEDGEGTAWEGRGVQWDTSLPWSPQKIEHLHSGSLGSSNLEKQQWMNQSMGPGPQKGPHSRPLVLGGVCGSTGFKMASDEWQRGDLAKLLILYFSFGCCPLWSVSWTVLVSSVFMVQNLGWILSQKPLLRETTIFSHINPAHQLLLTVSDLCRT